MPLDRTDATTHMLCPACQAYYKLTPKAAQDFFSNGRGCPPEMVVDIGTPGINIVFEDGCLNCQPREAYQISTSQPRLLMH